MHIKLNAFCSYLATSSNLRNLTKYEYLLTLSNIIYLKNVAWHMHYNSPQAFDAEYYTNLIAVSSDRCTPVGLWIDPRFTINVSSFRNTRSIVYDYYMRNESCPNFLLAEIV